MSNNELLQWIVIFLIGSWIPGLFIPRANKWAFALWLPLTAASCFGTCLFLYSLFLLTQGGWDAVGGAFGALSTFICPFLLVLNLWYRPRTFNPLVVAPTTGFCIAGAILFFNAPNHIDRRPVELQLVNINNEAIADASIEYWTLSHENGRSPSIQGRVTTDSEGKAILYTRRLHEIFGTIKKDGYSRCEFHFRPAYQFGFHQTAISWQGAAESPSFQDNQSAMIDVPATDTPELTLYLPRKGIDTWLPYPPYEPTWLPKTK